ncbi:hypothetical protein AB0M20_39790, partial [Actinoplanes sp. NPDC051633]|uniref:hypothetical protein n=1 Tax=Actinoplanes sp. NPDC051633 TaxID=3155670 RepID=UPI0034346296
MTTRRTLFIIGGGAIVAGAAGLMGRSPRADTAADVPGVVLAGTDAGLTILAGTRRRALGNAAAAGVRGAPIYAVTGDSRLERLDSASPGVTVGRGWIPRVVSGDGGSCALARTLASARPAARTSSPLQVVMLPFGTHSLG